MTILDKDNAPVAFLGDNPQRVAVGKLSSSIPARSPRTTFSAAHGCYIDASANIYVSDWNHTGRITKLVRTAG